MPKPQPFYAKFNQAPRSPHGRNRRADPKNHSDPLDGTGASAGGAKTRVRTSLPTATWRTIYPPVMPFSNAGIDPGLMQAMADYIAKNLHQTIIYGDEPPKVIPYEGIVTGELTSYRLWFVTEDYKLCSLAHYFIWEPGATITGDLDEVVHRSMYRHNNIYGGVYCFDSAHRAWWEFKEGTREDGLEYPTSVFDDEVIIGIALGTVKLWGEVVQHEKGYRASCAKLTSITAASQLADAQRLRAIYGV